MANYFDQFDEPQMSDVKRTPEGYPYRQAEAKKNYFDQFDEVRSGGQDFLMASVPWSPSVEELVAEGVSGTLFVHEVTTVRPGAGREYLAAMNEQWRPVALDHGHRLVGMYEALMTDTTVVTL